MPEQESTGTCALCGGSFPKGAMTAHLRMCMVEAHAGDDSGGKKKRTKKAKKAKKVEKAKTKPPVKARSVHLLVEGRYLPEYWMHLEAPADAMLYEIDAFLRHTWLECCGHLSAFRIGKTSYLGPAEAAGSTGELDMEIELGEVLKPRMKFLHEYDFGTTTELVLGVVTMAQGGPVGRGVRLLARNDPPVIPCSSCGKPAVGVCTECIWDDKGWLCKECVPKHECGEEMLLPVVNSPRVGQCGYTGPEEE